MPTIEDAERRAGRYIEYQQGGVIFVLTNNRDADRLLGSLSGHPKTEKLVFDEKSLISNHMILRDSQFKAQEGVLQVIEMSSDLYRNSMRGKLGSEVQTSVSDAFARRIMIVDGQRE